MKGTIADMKWLRLKRLEKIIAKDQHFAFTCCLFFEEFFQKGPQSNGCLLSYLTSDGSCIGLICEFSSFRYNLASLIILQDQIMITFQEIKVT